MKDQQTLFDYAGFEEWKPIHSTDWNWKLADLDKVPKNGLTVLSCFACGGGSTMGYKLAGCDVLGCVEIDKKMNEIYIANHHPKHNFLMDIRKFNAIPNDELPQELFSLDILDGSPPCTTFSMAGDREESWGKQKKFREGQALQTLDDLSFVFIETVQKLKPKVVFMENVGGILLGNAWVYVQKIYSDLMQTGYNLHHWLLKADKMGVPQARQRAIFIAIRNDIDFHPQKLDMCFNYYPITYGEIKSGDERVSSGKLSNLAKKAKDGEKTIADVKVRLGQKYGSFGHRIIDETSIFPTILGGHQDIWLRNGNNPSRQDFVSASTFPQDYDFGDTNHEYVCGMSVPPIMVKRIVERLLAHKEVIFGGAR